MTGGSRGIGAAIVNRLARSDRTVFLNHRDSEAAALTVQRASVGPGRGRVEVIRADITSPPDVHRMMARIAEVVGALHILVHNAAIPIRPQKLTDLDWDRDVQPHLAVACRGFLNCVQAARPFLIHGSRIIVLLTDALFHTPPVQIGAYLAGKAALWGLVRSAAKEFQGAGIRVYTVAPSMARTTLVDSYGDRALDILAAQHPAGRLVDPDEIAAVVEMLASDPGRYMHGSNVIVNGGLAF